MRRREKGDIGPQTRRTTQRQHIIEAARELKMMVVPEAAAITPTT
jgi:hypothetical protein